MKKMTLKMWLLGGIAALSMLATSCADGVDSEPFSAGVTNTQLESPAAESFTTSFIGSGDNEQMKVTWPVVMGAGGYLCYAADVTDEANPVVVYAPQEIDGTSFQFPIAEDHTYLYSVKTLGNEALKNTEAAEATGVRYFHGIEGIKIDNGSDIGAFIADYLATNAETLDAARKADFNWELAFDLEAGGEYTIATEIDFNLIPARIRSLNPASPAKIVYQPGGALVTSAGLRLQNLRIDAAKADHQGLVCMNPTPSQEIYQDNLVYMNGKDTYKSLGAKKSAYIIEKPIELKNVWVKELKHALFNNYKDGMKNSWGITDLRIINSIVQVGVSSFEKINNQQIYLFYFRQGNNQVKNLTIQQSTIYSSTTYNQFLMGLAAQQHTAVFGSVGAGGVWKIDQSTILLPGNDKKMIDQGRNIQSSKDISNSVFVNVRALSDGNGSGLGGATVSNNTVYNSVHAGDSSNYDADVINGVAAPADPGFSQEQPALDLSAENGGANFTPTGNALADHRGDPRWLPAVAE